MKILTTILMLASLGAGIWAVEKTVEIMHAATAAMQIAQAR